MPNSRALAKTPNIFLTTEGLQRLSYNGQPTVTSIAIKGTPQHIPAGYQLVDRTAGVNDLLRPEHVAAGADLDRGRDDVDRGSADRRVGGVFSALERLRDFAVFKAIGVPTRSILAGLACRRWSSRCWRRRWAWCFRFVAGAGVPDAGRGPSIAYVALPVAGDRDRSAGQPRRIPARCRRRPGPGLRGALSDE